MTNMVYTVHMNTCVICQKPVQGRNRSHAQTCVGECDREQNRRRVRSWAEENPERDRQTTQRQIDKISQKRFEARLGRKCGECGQSLPDDAHWNLKFHPECYKLRSNRAVRERHAANPELLRWENILKRHSLSMEKYEEIFKDQKGICPICLEDLGIISKEIHVDHDHLCCPGNVSCENCVRGLLHRSCNNGLGCFNDDISRLERAIDYLKQGKFIFNN